MQTTDRILTLAAGPLQHLLGPVHPEEAVHLALMDELQLSSVPQIVVGSRPLQLLPGVHIVPHIFPVVIKCLFRPIGGTFDGVIMRVVVAEVLCELSPHNSLFQERVHSLLVPLSLGLHIECSTLHGDLTKPDPGAEVRESNFIRVVPTAAIVGEPF